MFRVAYFAAALVAGLIQWPTPAASAEPSGIHVAVVDSATGRLAILGPCKATTQSSSW